MSDTRSKTLRQLFDDHQLGWFVDTLSSTDGEDPLVARFEAFAETYAEHVDSIEGEARGIPEEVGVEDLVEMNERNPERVEAFVQAFAGSCSPEMLTPPSAARKCNGAIGGDTLKRTRVRARQRGKLPWAVFHFDTPTYEPRESCSRIRVSNQGLDLASGVPYSTSLGAILSPYASLHVPDVERCVTRRRSRRGGRRARRSRRWRRSRGLSSSARGDGPERPR